MRQGQFVLISHDNDGVTTFSADLLIPCGVGCLAEKLKRINHVFGKREAIVDRQGRGAGRLRLEGPCGAGPVLSRPLARSDEQDARADGLRDYPRKHVDLVADPRAADPR